MLRTAISLICALAVLSPVAAFAGERYDRRDFNRVRTIERVRVINFGNRNRAFDRRDNRDWERRNVRRDWERERDWRDRRYDRREYRRDRYGDRREYRRDRGREQRIIIFPRISF